MRGHLVLLVVAASIAGRGSSEKTYKIEDGNGSTATVTTSDGDEVARIQTEDASVVVRQGANAASFPDYAPQYPGSTVVSSMDYQTDQDGAGGNVTMQTSDDVPKVMAFYKKSVASVGLKVVMETNTGTGSMLAVSSKANDSPDIMISAGRNDDGQTTIALTSSVQK